MKRAWLVALDWAWRLAVLVLLLWLALLVNSFVGPSGVYVHP